MKTATKTPAAEFPFIISFEGRRYYDTSKRGTDVRTGLRSAEYADLNDSRVWLDTAGHVDID